MDKMTRVFLICSTFVFVVMILAAHYIILSYSYDYDYIKEDHPELLEYDKNTLSRASNALNYIDPEFKITTYALFLVVAGLLMLLLACIMEDVLS